LSKPTLAVALIVKNEEKHLQACLDTVKDWADEIVLLDSGSTDRTEEIARQYTDKFYTNLEWPGFGKQRQLAQNYVASDFVLWLDADEQVTPELKESILKAVSEDAPNTLYKVNRLSAAFGKFIYHSGWSPDWIVRLYRTRYTQYNDALVHEKVEDKGFTTKKLDGRLHHHTYENLHHCVEKNTKYAKAWADQREGKKSVNMADVIIHSLGAFLRVYIFKKGFLDGKYGFILAGLSSYYTFIKYADLYIRNSTKIK